MIKTAELENFLYKEYPKRLAHIQRCLYLGITPDESRYALELEAYEKEQEYRKLTGKKPLDPIKSINIL